MQEVIEVFPDCSIDLFVKGNLASILFENYKNIDELIKLPRKPFKSLIDYSKVWLALRKKKYDLVLNIDANSSSGRLSTKFSKAKFKSFGDEGEALQSQYPDYGHIAKAPVYNFRYLLSQIGLKPRQIAIPSLNLKLDEEELNKGKKQLDELIDPRKRTICIYTFATGEKCYSRDWWLEFYDQLLARYPGYNIFEMLPIENVSQVDFKAPSFYSKDLRLIASIFANTEVFIGADSGMMHLASASGIPVIGLFSVTSIPKYEPYNTGSVAIDTNSQGVADIFKAVDKIL